MILNIQDVPHHIKSFIALNCDFRDYIRKFKKNELFKFIVYS